MLNDAEAPDTTPPPACAPVSVYLISFTPAHPEVSTALRSTVTVVLFHPAVFDAGDGTALLVGGLGVRSFTTISGFPLFPPPPRAGNGEPGSKVRSPVAGLIAYA